MKLLYFHIPKTAGSSINNFFSKNIRNYHFHIESVKNLSPDFCRKFQFLSGHVPYNRMSKMLNLNEWITFVTFRDPLS
ncbi:MAG: sulfotransferase family 2 protein, partial [Campylobacterota bacterium]|nr:sulfotransferase family 2 protein [Campylobacterota bacterium]